MRRIVYDVPRWSIYLHRQERELPLVKEDDSKDLRFEDEVFERLYGEESVELAGGERDHAAAEWAVEGHRMCGELGLDVVRPYCRDSPFNAALATTWLMELIEELLGGAKAAAEESQGGGGSEAAEGLENVDLTAVGIEGGGQDKVEQLAEYLKRDPRLLQIALLAGRLRSTIITKQRSKKTGGAQEIVNITVGGEIDRLLPSELVRFASRRLRLAAMRDLIERKLLQYEMIAEEPLQQGPIVVCLDKSLSMEGDRDVWGTAVALGMLEVARRQKRAFAVICFNHGVIDVAVVKAGEKLDVRSLMLLPNGATSIAAALVTALKTIQGNGTVGKADVVLISDGEDANSIAPAQIKRQADVMGMTIFGVGIATECVKPWCHQSHVITDLSSVDDQTAEMLFTR